MSIHPIFSAARIAELIAGPEATPLMPTTEQQLVIEHPLRGSALVVAGAGSGKTETMANRVVWLVANGLLPAEQVLGLTFTRKAAGELGERINHRLSQFSRQLNDAAERGQLSSAESMRAVELNHFLADGLDLPEVSTYHSFAAGVVQEFGPLAGIAPGLTLIDGTMAWRLARETIVRSRDPELIETSRTTSSLVERVLALGQLVSDHLTSFDRVDQVVEEFSRTIALPYNTKELNGAPSGKVYAPVRDAVAALGETPLITRLAREFAEAKQQRGLIEFSDQLRLAMLTLEQSPEAIAVLRKRHRAVLLDEVQDTSVGQTRLLSKIFAGAPVMAVGDPHQSIYAWRGASAEGLLTFHRDFRSGQSQGEERFAEHTLTLSTSWRNPQRVLDAANTIAGPLRAESAIEVPQLTARPGADDGHIEWCYPETIEEERISLAEWMRDARGTYLAQTGKLPTAAVVFRKRAHMAAFSAALSDAGVPNRIAGVGGLLTTPEITDVVSTLRCLWFADAGSDLIRVLAGPRFSIGVKDLEGLRLASRWFAQRDVERQPLSEADREADRVLPDPDRSFTILDAIDEIAGLRSLDHSALRDISEEGRLRLRDAGLMLRHLRAVIGEGVLETIRAVEHALRLDIELEAQPSRSTGAAARANLDLFHDLVEQFLAVDEEGSLASVLAWLERASEDDEVAEHIPPPEPGTVQLITAHGAKGLEWDLVAIPRAVQGELPASSREGSGWLRAGEIPDELRGDAASRPKLNWRLAATQQEVRDAITEYKAELRERKSEEERRLAYVAVTRAASRLLITGSFWAGQQQARMPSEYLVELGEAGLIEGIPSESVNTENPTGENEHTLSWPLDPLGNRSGAVLRAANQLRAEMSRHDTEPTDQPEVRELDPVIELLLAERRSRGADGATPTAPQRTSEAGPERITASTFHEFIESPEAAERRRRRPLPLRPYRRTRLGNRFHEWVERRATTIKGTEVALLGLGGDGGLWGFEGVETESADDVDTVEHDSTESGSFKSVSTASEDRELQRLIETFEASRWSDRQPIAVELEVSVPFAGRRLVCKLDAVYRSEGDPERIEIVDWKAGRSPRNEAERRSRFFQLDLYRQAYAAWAGIPPERIDVSLFYVSEGVELRGETPRSLEELESLWLEAADSLLSPSDSTEPSVAPSKATASAAASPPPVSAASP